MSTGLLALLGALFEDDVRVAVARGTFASFRSLLQSQFLYVPHDVVVPGVLKAGDIADVVASLPPCAVRIDGCVNGLNRAVAKKQLTSPLSPATSIYSARGLADQLSIATRSTPMMAVDWILTRLAR